MTSSLTFNYKGYPIRCHPYESKYNNVKAYNTKGFSGEIPVGAKCDGRCDKDTFSKYTNSVVMTEANTKELRRPSSA